MLEKLRLEELEGNSMLEVMENLFARIPGWDDAVFIFEKCAAAFLILGILLALLQCFGGYKLRRIWTTEVGLAVSGIAAAIAAMEYALPVAAVIAITIAAAVVGALLTWFLWKLGMFLRVLAAVFLVIFAAFVAGDMAVVGIIAGLAAGLIAGILILALHKPMTILYTALSGGILAAVFVQAILPIHFSRGIIFTIGGGLALCGTLVQWLTSQKADEKPEAAGDLDTAASEVVEVQLSAEETVTEGGKPQLSEAAEAVEQEEVQPESKASEKLLCPDCGAGYKAGAKFCIMCGKKLV